MSHDDEEEPKDWEIKEEVPSDKLKYKWAQEDWEGAPPVICPSCKKSVKADILNCIYCGGPIPQSGFLMKFLSFLKRMFK